MKVMNVAIVSDEGNDFVFNAYEGTIITEETHLEDPEALEITTFARLLLQGEDNAG